MSSSAKLAVVAACAGDPARASMLWTLIDGRAFTAGELSEVAGVTPQTASGHLARMVDAGLISVAKQGRHRYFRLASPLVAQMLEGIMVVVGTDAAILRPGPANDAMRLARACYDHLAGRVAVAIAQSLADRGHVTLSEDGGAVTPEGATFFGKLGVSLEPQRGRRPLCRPCLDWSERRYHIAGTLGAGIAETCYRCGWLKRKSGTRVVEITAAGRKGLRETFGVELV